MKKRIQFVQKQLKKDGFRPGPADGILGPKTLGALNKVEGIDPAFSNRRKVIAYIQLTAQRNGIDSGHIDGYWGPQTEFAFESLQHLVETGNQPPIWRPEDLTDKNPHKWPLQTTKELNKSYGKVGTNQVNIDLPYPNRLSWQKNKVIRRFKCNKKVQDSLKKVLTKVFDHYGIEKIKDLRLDIWGGCLNVRKKRGGKTYSTHSWGIAVDYDPENNRLKWGMTRATFAKPEYDKWWEIWETEGWVSLGRQRNFDWMHIQAAKLK